MRPWAQWTARCWLPRAALVAAGFAATSAGLSGVALAAAGDGNPSGSVSVLGGNQIGLPVSVPATVCGLSGALLGVAEGRLQWRSHLRHESREQPAPLLLARRLPALRRLDPPRPARRPAVTPAAPCWSAPCWPALGRSAAATS